MAEPADVPAAIYEDVGHVMNAVPGFTDAK